MFFRSVNKKSENTMRTKSELDHLHSLGNKQTDYLSDYSPSVLEAFENQHADHDYLVSLNCPEFTTLCPKTGQPDFARIVINYIPDKLMVESKSLKLYLFSFRNHGDFHEDCVNIILRDLVRLMQPRYIEVIGLFVARGGISIHPFVNYADDAHQSLLHSRMMAQMNSTIQ